MVGMWIAFAFVAGMVLIGFKSRQLKWYEFIVSGLFLLLLDRLVFHGQISSWIGQIGSKAQGAASHGALHGAMAFPFLATSGARARVRRFVARLWANRPSRWELAAYLAGALASHWMLGLSWPIGAGIFTAALVIELIWYTATDHDQVQEQGVDADARPPAADITRLHERRRGAGER